MGRSAAGSFETPVLLNVLFYFFKKKYILGHQNPEHSDWRRAQIGGQIRVVFPEGLFPIFLDFRYPGGGPKMLKKSKKSISAGFLFETSMISLILY